jgi:DNA-binding winged helix-turn-helix (wHTH) protein/tetratricopeptide (TPR) repeat protein/TolB-like protein
MPPETTRVYEFGIFTVDAQKRLLTRGSTVVPLTPKTFDTLLLLLNNRGRVVPKKDLMEALWPDSFVEESNLSQNIFMLRKALGETAQDHQFVVTLPGSGYRFAADVTEIGPEALVEPTDKSAPTDFVLSRAAAGGVRRRLVQSAILASIVGFSLLVIGRKIDLKPSPKLALPMTASASTAPPRRSLAVLGFRNLSNRPQESWLSTALAEMLSTELASGEKLRIIPGDEVARARTEIGWTGQRFPPQSSLPNFGSDLLVTGSYAVIGEGKDVQIRIGARIQDAKTGEILTDIAETGPDSTLFELISRTGARLRNRLGIQTLSATEALVVRASLPSGLLAAQLYSEGLDKLRTFDALGAELLLSRTILLEPSFPLAHSALSTAWAALGYDSKASDEAKKAYDLSVNLSREDRLRVQARYWLTRHEWDKAIAACRALAVLHPDDLDDGLRLASALNAASRGHEALEVIDGLRHLPNPTGQDPRIDLEAALSWSTLGDFQKMPALLTSAADRAKAQAATLLLGQARNQECWVFRFMAQQQSNFDACKEALTIFSAAGNQGKVADTLRIYGAAMSASDPVAASRMYRESLKIQHKIGNVAGEAVVVNALAIQAAMQNDHATAAREFRRARDLFLKIDHKVAAAGLLINIGGELVCDAKLQEALRLFEGARDSGRLLGNKDLEGFALYNIGIVQQDRGNLHDAKQFVSEARELFKQVDDRSEVASTQFTLGEIATAEGDFKLARKLHTEALQVRRDAGERLAIAQSELDIADLSLEEGRPLAEIEEATNRAIDVFRELKSINDEAKAEALLAQLLVREERREAARQSLRRAEAASLRSDRYDSVASMIGIAKSRGAFAGKSEKRQGAANLKMAIAKAHVYGYSGLELEGRLALGEMQLTSGNYEAASATLNGVVNDAHACGMILLSNQASAKLADVGRERAE